MCVCVCMWQRAPEILCCVQGTHAGSPKVPLCACPDYALRIGNVETWKCVSVLEEHRAPVRLISLFGSLISPAPSTVVKVVRHFKLTPTGHTSLSRTLSNLSINAIEELCAKCVVKCPNCCQFVFVWVCVSVCRFIYMHIKMCMWQLRSQQREYEHGTNYIQYVCMYIVLA